MSLFGEINLCLIHHDFVGVALKLLENGARPHARDENGNMPIKTAIQDKKNDEMSAILLSFMPNHV